ncbi:phosphatase PAP2 family protein [Paraburkholderia diazotrophica]|uniref:phosphatase PAP2 family protein n=1 Tax=Paraburkholderia diazotrophica TaxID=667676 RepID=UPI00317FC890
MWMIFTNIGDAALTVPVAILCAAWLARVDVVLACRWILALTCGMALVGATKVLYSAWGIALPLGHFRVISGHTMLSTAVWIVTIALLAKWWRQPPSLGIVMGLLIGALTGYSRVFDHSHSVMEVIVGWVVGVIAAAWFLRTALHVEFRKFRPIWATLSLLAVSTVAYGHKAPLQDIIDAKSEVIRGHAPTVRCALSNIRPLSALGALGARLPSRQRPD